MRSCFTTLIFDVQGGEPWPVPGGPSPRPATHRLWRQAQARQLDDHRGARDAQPGCPARVGRVGPRRRPGPRRGAGRQPGKVPSVPALAYNGKHRRRDLSGRGFFEKPKGGVSMHTRRTRELVAVVTCLLLAASLAAQIGGSGTVKGTVFDPSAAVVPHATVTAINVATGVETRRETTPAGLYVIAPLPAGTRGPVRAGSPRGARECSGDVGEFPRTVAQPRLWRLPRALTATAATGRGRTPSLHPRAARAACQAWGLYRHPQSRLAI